MPQMGATQISSGFLLVSAYWALAGWLAGMVYVIVKLARARKSQERVSEWSIWTAATIKGMIAWFNTSVALAMAWRTRPAILAGDAPLAAPGVNPEEARTADMIGAASGGAADGPNSNVPVSAPTESAVMQGEV
mmetsp:Transcript_54285/g.142960  ORF Transcript_54285/g.142960 Transcript_54285/m.142960 type:complete len:134 (+) Transcript_54285:88-489(+)